MIVSGRGMVLCSCFLVGTVCGPAARARDGKKNRPYRLKTLSVKQPLLWGAKCRLPDGRGLAFGGQDRSSADGRPHTRVLVDGSWRAIHRELRKANALQGLRDRAWRLRNEIKDIRAVARRLWFRGLPAEEEAGMAARQVRPAQQAFLKALGALIGDLRAAKGLGDYEVGQARFAAAGKLIRPIQRRVEAADIRAMRECQVRIAVAAEALDAEPPARALSPIAYDPRTKLFVIFGGDHLDYLTNDTWVFDPAGRQWRQRRPTSAPAPRAGHTLTASGDGTIKLTGGFTYYSNTDYCGGQYVDLSDGDYTYDVAKNTWRGARLQPGDARVYRTGPFHPGFYMQGDRPDAAAFEAKLKELPANQWVATDPPYRPRLNRDWGTAVIDTRRDMLLRWSGGHSAHGGTDVPHFHFATNRWELAYPVEFPLGQLYSNTSYPGGYNLNLRPGMTGHTYQNYGFDPISGNMVQTGHYEHFYVYDPNRADWVSRGPKPKGMQYNSCFYTLTLCTTSKGLLCWTKDGRLYLYKHAAGEWAALEATGAKLPGAVVDHSTLAFDSRRGRVLFFVKAYGKAPYDGQVYEFGLESGRVAALSPANAALASRAAWIDRCCYDPVNDVVLMATYLDRDSQRWTPTPAYDCARNEWTALSLKYDVKPARYRARRAMPHGHSAGVMFDPKRKLIWGTDTNSQVYALKLHAPTARAGGD